MGYWGEARGEARGADVRQGVLGWGKGWGKGCWCEARGAGVRQEVRQVVLRWGKGCWGEANGEASGAELQKYNYLIYCKIILTVHISTSRTPRRYISVPAVHPAGTYQYQQYIHPAGTYQYSSTPRRYISVPAVHTPRRYIDQYYYKVLADREVRRVPVPGAAGGLVKRLSPQGECYAVVQMVRQARLG